MSKGIVYLLHFDRPISPGKHTAQHYIGFAADLAARLEEHAAGHGARLTQVAVKRGIGWQVARLWRGGRTLERRLKDRKSAPRLCPCCGDPLPVRYAEEIAQQEIGNYTIRGREVCHG